MSSDTKNESSVTQESKADVKEIFTTCQKEDCMYFDLISLWIDSYYNESMSALVNLYHETFHALDEWRVNTSDSKVSKAELFAPFIKKAESDEIKKVLSFTKVRDLDFCALGVNSNTYWRGGFKNPSIGTILHSENFGYDVPLCGYIVIDHGIFTQTLALNVPSIIEKTKEMLKLKHDQYCSESSKAHNDRDSEHEIWALEKEINKLSEQFIFVDEDDDGGVSTDDEYDVDHDY